MSKKRIVIIGGGPAGLEAAAAFPDSDYQVTVLEREETTGGKLKQWHHLFPNFRDSAEVKEYLSKNLKVNNPVVIKNAEAVEIQTDNHVHSVKLKDGQQLEADAIMIATGFKLFDAERKEEYGYKIYDNVITSADLEGMLNKSQSVKTSSGKIPARIAFIHCVGSRDKKAGNIYCSRVCCVTGVKQAIEMKKLVPSARVFNFYMDLRMYGQNFEELYLEAQQKWGVSFIRGRVSEIAENIDGSLQLKAEDTLSGRPIKMNFDLVVLLIGMVPESCTAKLGKSARLNFTADNFLAGSDVHFRSQETNVPGIFLAGTCKEPMSIQETLTDARAAAGRVISWFHHHKELKS
jgi:heterodisulfide reductase subunit A2